MQHLLVIDNTPLRIGTLDQMLAFKCTYLPADTEAHIMPVSEVKRVIPYYYSENDGNTGNPLWLFADNCKVHAEGYPVIKLPVHCPQMELL